MWPNRPDACVLSGQMHGLIGQIYIYYYRRIASDYSKNTADCTRVRKMRVVLCTECKYYTSRIPVGWTIAVRPSEPEEDADEPRSQVLLSRRPEESTRTKIAGGFRFILQKDTMMSKILSLDSSVLSTRDNGGGHEKVYKDDPDIRWERRTDGHQCETHETSMYYIRLRPIYERARAFACKSGG